MEYKELMQQALLLAKEAANHGDVPVGAIIVDEKGEVIGRGKNERVKNNDPLAHAEMVAIHLPLTATRFNGSPLAPLR